MMDPKRASRGAAGAAAGLLLLTGALLGITVERLWLRPDRAAATPLTADAMAAHLDLDEATHAQVRALLDSLHVDVTAAAAHGADSLRVVARRAQDRLVAALPPESRAAFKAWLNEHHTLMMERTGELRDHGPVHSPSGVRH